MLLLSCHPRILKHALSTFLDIHGLHMQIQLFIALNLAHIFQEYPAKLFFTQRLLHITRAGPGPILIIAMRAEG